VSGGPLVPRSLVSSVPAIPRGSITDNTHILLVTEVLGHCPLCSRSLLYEKRKAWHKGYQIAHIYPLHPTRAEALLLQNEERLSSDPDADENLIALCPGCHGTFDKPRTVEEYRDMVALKRRLLVAAKVRSLWHANPLEEELERVVQALVAFEPGSLPIELALSPKRVEEKTDQSMTPVLRRKIVVDVQDYFPFVRGAFQEIERDNPGVASQIAQQVRGFYVAVSRHEQNQERIYESIAGWVQRKVPSCSRQAAEVLTSFFVQNCEVFE
jgi:hypothetical protein